jgi:hypothetical protein
MSRLAAEEAEILSMYGVARRVRVNEAHTADKGLTILFVNVKRFFDLLGKGGVDNVILGVEETLNRILAINYAFNMDFQGGGQGAEGCASAKRAPKGPTLTQ